MVWMSGFSLLLAGCGTSAAPMGEKKETTGKLTLNGKPLADVKVVLQPLGDGADAHAVTDKVGAFKAQATPGKETWYVLPKEEKKDTMSMRKERNGRCKRKNKSKENKPKGDEKTP